MKRLCIILCFLITFSSAAAFASQNPDCGSADGWVDSMAFAALKNAKVTDNDKVDFSKTKIVKVASQKIGKDKDDHSDLYRQVYDVTFTEKSGKRIEVLTVSEATNAECSMGKVDVFVVSKHL